MNTAIKRFNYFDDKTGGVFWPFLFWINNTDRRYWSVIGCGSFVRDGKAVVDNFGNLVEVV